MKHTICTAAGRVTVEPAESQGRRVVQVRVSNLPGLTALLLPALLIEPHEAALLAQAFDLVAEECAADPTSAAGVSAPEKAAAALAGTTWPAFPGERAA